MGNEDWFESVKAKNIKIYAYNVFDTNIEVNNNMRYVYGIYADVWNKLKK